MNTSYVTLVSAFLPLRFKYPPLGVLYLKNYLELHGTGVEVRDLQLHDSVSPFSPESLADFSESGSPVIAFSCMSDFLPVVLSTISVMKKRDPGRKFFIGGPGPSGVAVPLMNKFPDVDGVIIGEGEETFNEAIMKLRNGAEAHGTAGLISRIGNRLISCPGRSRIKELDSLPEINYASVDLSMYEGVSVSTARGCPYECSFCDAGPIWEHRVAFRSINRVIDEMLLLKEKFNQRTFSIVDDTFLADRRRTAEFCGRIISEAPGITWKATGRINLLDRELIDLLSRAGLDQIFLGIESGSDRILKSVNKGFTSAEVKRVIRDASGSFDIKASFIWGFPDESLDDFLSTIELFVYCHEHGALSQILALAPMPQSKIYRRYRERLELRPVRTIVGWGALSRTGETGSPVPEEILLLIERNPDVFPNFYMLPTPDLDRKLKILRQLGQQGPI